MLTNNFDPAILNGWGVRPSDWTLDVSIQRQILPRASATLAYSRRWFHGFTVADNLALQPSDLTPFSVVAPVDPRLPGGGGYVVSGLYDVAPDKAGQVSNLIADSSKYGRWYQYLQRHRCDAQSAGRRFHVHGGDEHGTDRGRQLRGAGAPAGARDDYSGREPAWPRARQLHRESRQPVLPCRLRHPDAVQGPGLIRAAGNRRSAVRNTAKQARGDAGGELRRAERRRGVVARPEPVRERAQRHGESGGARYDAMVIASMSWTSASAKILRHGRSRTMVALDIYNALNSSAGLTYNNAFVPGAPWPRPNTILTPRFFRITVEIEF